MIKPVTLTSPMIAYTSNGQWVVAINTTNSNRDFFFWQHF